IFERARLPAVPLKVENIGALAPGEKRLMKIEVFADADAVAQQAAALIAAKARAAVSTRSSFVMAVSGGHTPWIMLRDLAREDVPWNPVHLLPVTEQIP